MKDEKEIKQVMEEIIEIRNSFVQLSEKEQMFVAGIIEGMIMMKNNKPA